MNQIWHCCKIGQGQPRVIISINLVVSEYNASYLLSRPSAFLFQTRRILVMWPGPFEQTFVPSSHRSSIWNLTLIGAVVSEEKMVKECGRRRQCTTEAYLSYKLSKWASGSGELKRLRRSLSWGGDMPLKNRKETCGINKASSKSC